MSVSQKIAALIARYVIATKFCKDFKPARRKRAIIRNTWEEFTGWKYDFSLSFLIYLLGEGRTARFLTFARVKKSANFKKTEGIRIGCY